MFKEILHYTFKRPHAAFDISAFHHHGQAIAVGHSTDGAEPGSGACLFDGKTSRVHVPFSKAWRDLGAIKIEALARSDAEFLEKAHVLIEGHLSFSLVLLPDHTVAAYVLVSKESDGSTPGSASHDPFSTFTAMPIDPDEPQIQVAWIGVATDAFFAPDGIRRTVTPGDWTRVTFIHNGFSLQLWLDDELAAYRDDDVVKFGVLGVQPGGIHIGNHLTGGEMLQGALDELRIWKLDPLCLDRRFFCRPMDEAQESCWRGLYEHIMRRWRDPDSRPAVEQALSCIGDALNDLMRAIYRQGTEAIVDMEKFGRRYDRLWCEDRIDGPEMVTFLKEFGEWTQAVAGEAFADSIVKLIGCRRELYEIVQGYDLTCIADHDPKWLACGKLVGEHALPGFCSPPRSTPPDDPYPPKQGY